MVSNSARWKEASFREVLKLDRGSSPRPIVNYVTDSFDGVNWIKIGDTKSRDLYIDSTKERITPEGAKKSRRVSKGEIILSNSMSFGKPYILNIDGYIHDGWFVIRKYEEHLKKEFLIQVLSSELIQRQYKRLAAGGVVSNISSDLVYAVKIKLPPLPEQKKIAQILSTWDQAITATERLLENSQQRKKGLMQQLLTGKKRLPGFEGEWEARSIAQTGKIVSGGTPDTNKSDLWGGDVQWLTPTDITALKTHFIYDTPRKITEKGVKESSATLMPPGSLCVCTRASVGLMAISTTRITTNQGFKSVVPNHKHDSEFLYYLFSFNRHVFVRYSSGSTFLELSKKDFEKIVFDYPSLAEQKAIARVLASASDEIEQLQKRIDCLKHEKKALMQQLLTGKRRVQVEPEAA
jgi:type I restriction enzyme S subunit